jgi:hypothetical protein
MSREFDNRAVEYYELRRVTIPPLQPGESRLTTAAVITCSLCGRTIDGMGGPGCGPICIPCGDLVKRGQARGAVVWTGEHLPATEKSK